MYEKAIMIDPYDKDSYFNKGRIIMIQGNALRELG